MENYVKVISRDNREFILNDKIANFCKKFNEGL